jgi:hypothetical protein
MPGAGSNHPCTQAIHPPGADAHRTQDFNRGRGGSCAGHSFLISSGRSLDLASLFLIKGRKSCAVRTDFSEISPSAHIAISAGLY